MAKDVADTEKSNPIAELSYEEAIHELEQIVSRLEKGEEPLEKTVELFTRGNALAAHCESILKTMEEKVTQIIQTSDGTIEEITLEEQ